MLAAPPLKLSWPAAGNGQRANAARRAGRQRAAGIDVDNRHTPDRAVAGKDAAARDRKIAGLEQRARTGGIADLQHAAVDHDRDGLVGAVEDDRAGIDIDLADGAEAVSAGVGECPGAEIEIDVVARAAAHDVAGNTAAGNIEFVGVGGEQDRAGDQAAGLIDGHGVLTAPLTSIAVPPVPLMVPELAMAPENPETCGPTTMPVMATMVPELVMPPLNVPIADEAADTGFAADEDAATAGRDDARIADAAGESRYDHFGDKGCGAADKNAVTAGGDQAAVADTAGKRSDRHRRFGAEAAEDGAAADENAVAGRAGRDGATVGDVAGECRDRHNRTNEGSALVVRSATDENAVAAGRRWSRCC